MFFCSMTESIFGYFNLIIGINQIWNSLFGQKRKIKMTCLEESFKMATLFHKIICTHSETKGYKNWISANKIKNGKNVRIAIQIFHLLKRFVSIAITQNLRVINLNFLLTVLISSHFQTPTKKTNSSFSKVATTDFRNLSQSTRTSLNSLRTNR